MPSAVSSHPYPYFLFLGGGHGGKRPAALENNLFINFHRNFSKVLKGVLFVVVPFGGTFGELCGRIDERIDLGGFHDPYESFERQVELL